MFEHRCPDVRTAPERCRRTTLCRLAPLDMQRYGSAVVAVQVLSLAVPTILVMTRSALRCLDRDRAVGALLQRCPALVYIETSLHGRYMAARGGGTDGVDPSQIGACRPARERFTLHGRRRASGSRLTAACARAVHA
jgi:hypothetical protein